MTTAAPQQRRAAAVTGAGGGLGREIAVKVIEAAEQVPAPIRVPVGPDAEEILPMVREKSDAELDAVRMQLLGLAPLPASAR